MPGVFDKDKQTDTRMAPEQNKETTVSEIPNKVDFKGPEELAREQSSERMNRASKTVQKSSTEDKIDQINQMMGGDSEQKKLEEEFDNLEKVTAEDLKLAEEIMFKGNTEKIFENPHFKDTKFTICTMNADEVSIVEEMLYDMAKANEDENGIVDIPEIKIRNMRNIYNLALSYKGKNGQDFMADAVYKLDIIKRAISKVSEYEFEGNIKDLKELKDSVKKSIIKRSIEIRKLPTPVIDMLTNWKYSFEQMMFTIMNAKGVLPKS